MLLTAATISISARTVGALVISSLVVPNSYQVARSYKQTVLYSIIFALISTISGLYISFYADFKPGATIVLVGSFYY